MVSTYMKKCTSCFKKKPLDGFQNRESRCRECRKLELRKFNYKTQREILEEKKLLAKNTRDRIQKIADENGLAVKQTVYKARTDENYQPPEQPYRRC